MSFPRGTVIAGKYRVERTIGQGGMGVVLAARHLGLDEMVAVKLIREERAQGVDALARFQREARAVARIKSEHVARVLDVDRLPQGQPYIVMELIDGADLHAIVEGRGALPPHEAAGYVLQACEGLAEAHALGMVHRDLKLKNLFLTKRRDGRALIKVIDFGVVKLTPIGDDTTLGVGVPPSTEALERRARDATLTGAAVLVGSVHYMAPEQIRASNVVDARADIWSLGVCLYTMLGGTLPFDGETVASVCAAIQGLPPRDVRAHAPNVPDGLAIAVMRALEKDVRRRFGSVAELAAALAPFAHDDAAPSRIAAILQSSSETPAPSIVQTGDARPIAMMGRVESTIDAAAVGSLPSSSELPFGAKKKRGWLTGAVIAFVGAATTVAIGGRTLVGRDVAPPITAAAPSPSPSPSPSPPPSPPPSPSSPPPPPPEPVATVAPTPLPVVLPSAAPAATGHAPGRRPPRTPKAGQASPKAEPSSAYDHF